MKLKNGKTYPMWGGIVDAKEHFIGGTLTDLVYDESTEIVDLKLEWCAGGYAMFSVQGVAYDCCVNVEYAGVRGNEKGDGMIIASICSGLQFEIQKANKDVVVTTE